MRSLSDVSVEVCEVEHGALDAVAQVERAKVEQERHLALHDVVQLDERRVHEHGAQRVLDAHRLFDKRRRVVGARRHAPRAPHLRVVQKEPLAHTRVRLAPVEVVVERERRAAERLGKLENAVARLGSVVVRTRVANAVQLIGLFEEFID